MFIYQQAPPRLSREGLPIKSSTLYSGHGSGLNNPNYEDQRGVGPIPRGKWRIVRWDEHHGELGPIVAILEPVGHAAFGRSLFRVHGDNALANFTASDGCIVADHETRVAWRRSGDLELEVI